MKLIALITVALLGGCTTQKFTEQEKTHVATCEPRTECAPLLNIPDAPTEQELQMAAQKKEDMGACQREAIMAAGCSQTGYSLYGIKFNDVPKTIKQRTLFKRCMESKGYTR